MKIDMIIKNVFKGNQVKRDTINIRLQLEENILLDIDTLSCLENV